MPSWMALATCIGLRGSFSSVPEGGHDLPTLGVQEVGRSRASPSDVGNLGRSRPIHLQGVSTLPQVGRPLPYQKLKRITLLQCQKKGAEQLSLETADQVLTAKKVELGNFGQRGVYGVVEKDNRTNTSGDCAVFTNEGHRSNAPVLKDGLTARNFVSDAMNRDTLLGARQVQLFREA